MRSGRVLPNVVLLSVATFGVSLSVYSTQHGVGASPDSVAYLGAASNVVAGSGLSLPYGGPGESALTQFPPLYPLVLAAVGTTVGSVGEGARWLAGMLFGANLLLIAGLTSRIAPHSRWASAVAAILFLVAPPVAVLHFMAWSEALFVFLVLLGLLLLFQSVTAATKWYASLSGMAFGLAALTRYAGLPFVLTAAVVPLLFARGSRKTRLALAGSMVALGIGPVLVWIANNTLRYGQSTGRVLAFHPAGKIQAWQAFSTLADWILIPSNWARRPELALLAILAVSGVVLYRIWKHGNHQAVLSVVHGQTLGPVLLRLLLVAFAAAYFVFLLISVSLVDANTPLDSRILAPVFVLLVPVAVAVVFEVGTGPEGLSFRRMLPSLAVGALVLGYGMQTYRLVQAAASEGVGFNHSSWRNSALLAAASKLPKGSTIFSNAPEPLYLLDGRRSARLPKPYESVSDRENPTFEKEVGQMSLALARSDARVVYFNRVVGPSIVSLGELMNRLPLIIEFETPDGWILKLEGGN
ncbi:MAG: glycosyltransferase family 39 protein [Anaerolineales bacterium]